MSLNARQLCTASLEMCSHTTSAALKVKLLNAEQGSI